MNTSKSWKLPVLLLLALAAGIARAESFPLGDVFRPLVADPTQPRTFLSVLSLEAPAQRYTVGSIGAGINFGLFRWQGESAGDGWQIGLFGWITSQFDLGSASDDLVNTDFRIGVPLSYRRGSFSARARVFHLSSHLGDEVILNGSMPNRTNLSIEVLDFLAAWDFGAWRPYAGGAHLLHADTAGFKKYGLQAGLDYVGSRPVLAGGRLVGGLDVKAFEEIDWKAGISAKIGLQFGRHDPERRGITMLLEAYDGPAPFGQFYRDIITYYGLSAQFDF